MIAPVMQDDAWLADIEAARAEPNTLHLWWLGQSGFLVQWQGRHLLLDPYLSDSLTKKYADTDKPHVRMTERVIDPARLGFVDAVTSSHAHTDHLDAETLNPIRIANEGLVLVIPEANREAVAQRLGCDAGWPLGLAAGEQVTVAGFTIAAVPASHEQREFDAAGRDKYLGYIVRCGQGASTWTIYHSGDTVRFPGMEEWLRPWNIDIALLPINGSAPERRVAGNLDGREAARLANAISAGVLIPCHYDMFEFNTATPDLMLATCQQISQPYAVLRNGQRWNGRK